MGKLSALEKALAGLDEQIRVLELAKEHLQAQMKKAPTRKRTRKEKADAEKDDAA